jgi:catechol 2,3-dioxygenase-like lactoylglutathione lyase family enzyme
LDYLPRERARARFVPALVSAQQLRKILTVKRIGSYSIMFRNTDAFSSFSVDDLNKAKQFYGDTLGLEVAETPEGLELHLAGGTRIFIYPSDDYNAPEHTILNFVVDDIERAVSELEKRGVRIEHYDLPGMKTDAKGIFRGNSGPKAIAWFKDPADHILSVLEER